MQRDGMVGYMDFTSHFLMFEKHRASKRGVKFRLSSTVNLFLESLAVNQKVLKCQRVIGVKILHLDIKIQFCQNVPNLHKLFDYKN